jgi:hypothetical protein
MQIHKENLLNEIDNISYQLIEYIDAFSVEVHKTIIQGGTTSLTETQLEPILSVELKQTKA